LRPLARLALLPLLTPLALAGCSSVAGSEAKRFLPKSAHYEGEPLFQSQPVGPPREQIFSVDWRKLLTEPEMLEWQPREYTRPAVDDSGRVYVATRDGFIRCLDNEGGLVWEYKTKGPFYGSIELDGDKLIVPSADGVLLCLNAPDGSLRWSYRAGEELGSKPLVANGLVYVASFADSVFAVDEETGAWKWQYRREVPAEFTIRGVATPAIDFDKLFVGFSDGSAMCLDANDGTLKWEKKLSNAPQFPDADANPQLDGQGHVIFASFASGIFSLDEETGQIIWAQSITGITNLLLDNDTLFAGGQGMLSARQVSNGTEVWHHSLGNSWSGEPTLAGRYLVVPTTQKLLFLDRKSGRPHRAFNPGRGISAPPAFRGGQLFVLSNWGYLYALSLSSPRVKG
jgi:outer membrane protein assembly factor BamB